MNKTLYNQLANYRFSIKIFISHFMLHLKICKLSCGSKMGHICHIGSGISGSSVSPGMTHFQCWSCYTRFYQIRSLHNKKLLAYNGHSNSLKMFVFCVPYVVCMSCLNTYQDASDQSARYMLHAYT